MKLESLGHDGAMDAVLASRVSSRFQTYLKRLISHFEDGVLLDDFLMHFKELSTAPLGYQQYGFSSAEDMIVALKSIFRTEYHGLTPWVYPVGNQPKFVRPSVPPSIAAKKQIVSNTPANPYQWSRTFITKDKIIQDTVGTSLESGVAEAEDVNQPEQTLLQENLQGSAEPEHVSESTTERQNLVETVQNQPLRGDDGGPTSFSDRSPATPVIADILIIEDLAVRLADHGLFVPSIALSACIGLSGDELLQRVVNNGLKVRGLRTLQVGERDYELVKLRLIPYGIVIPKDQDNLTMVPMRSCIMLLSIGQHREENDLLEKTIHEITQRYQERNCANTASSVNGNRPTATA